MKPQQSERPQTPAGDAQGEQLIQGANRQASNLLDGILTATASSESGTTVVKALACMAERGSLFPAAEVAARGGARRRREKPRRATTAAAEMAALRIAAIVESGYGGGGGKNWK
jgi:hypothetical protein